MSLLYWKNINFQHLNYFLIAARHLNFSEAADELYISYSTLSKAMTRLESQLNVKLFEKNGRNLKLTKYGKILAGHVGLAMTDLKNGMDEIELLSHQEQGEINLSSVFTVSSSYLPQRLNRFKAEYPDMDIYLTQTSTQEILHDIITGDIDVGFCGEFNFIDYKDDINREFIYDDEIVLIVPMSHPLASKKNVSFQDIKDEVFIGYNESAGMSHSIRIALERVAGKEFKLNTLYAMNEESGVIGMVRANHGIAFVSTRNALNYDDIKIIDVTDLSIIYNIYMVWQRSEYLPSSVNDFKNFIIADNRKFGV
jgi:DNA-binding transcriptional LysR family regulator